jgi:hypothetical protein
MMSLSLDPFENLKLKERDYDPEPERESVRGRITLAAFLTFGVAVTAYPLASIFVSSQSWPQIKEAMAVILPAVTSVLGTALGFYFGSQKR